MNTDLQHKINEILKAYGGRVVDLQVDLDTPTSCFELQPGAARVAGLRQRDAGRVSPV